MELSDKYKQRLRAGSKLDRFLPEPFALAQQIWDEFADVPPSERLKCALTAAFDCYSAHKEARALGTEPGAPVWSPEERAAKALERIADRLDSFTGKGDQRFHIRVSET